MNYKLFTILLGFSTIVLAGLSLYLVFVYFPLNSTAGFLPVVRHMVRWQQIMPPDGSATAKGLTGQHPGWVVSDYFNASFRIIGMKKLPKQPYTLLIAADRATSGAENDSQCGSVNTSPICYFFLEPDYAYHAPNVFNAPATRFVGQIERSGALDQNSIAFFVKDHMQFKTVEADGPDGFQATWDLDFYTGIVKELSRVDLDPRDKTP